MLKLIKSFLFFLTLSVSYNVMAESPANADAANDMEEMSMEFFDDEFDGDELSIERRRYRNQCYWIDCPNRCERTRGCRWSDSRDTCVEKRYRPPQPNRQCEWIDCPRQCERTRGCDWNRRYDQCVSRRYYGR